MLSQKVVSGYIVNFLWTRCIPDCSCYCSSQILPLSGHHGRREHQEEGEGWKLAFELVRSLWGHGSGVYGEDQISSAGADVWLVKDILSSPSCTTTDDMEKQKVGNPWPGRFSHCISIIQLSFKLQSYPRFKKAVGNTRRNNFIYPA